MVAIVTDNGAPFRSFAFEAVIALHPELAHVRTCVRRPGQNGFRERGFGTLPYGRLYLDQIDDGVSLAERAEDDRVAYTKVHTTRPSPSNRPKGEILPTPRRGT